MEHVHLRPIRNGGTFLIFAKLSQDGENRFTATGESAGMFEVLADGRIQPLFKTGSENPEIHDVPYGEIVRKILAVPARK